jgi:hypothetical protein
MSIKKEESDFACSITAKISYPELGTSTPLNSKENDGLYLRFSAALFLKE